MDKFLEFGVIAILLLVIGTVLIIPSSFTGFATVGGIDQFPGIKSVLGVLAVLVGLFILRKQKV